MLRGLMPAFNSLVAERDLQKSECACVSQHLEPMGAW